MLEEKIARLFDRESTAMTRTTHKKGKFILTRLQPLTPMLFPALLALALAACDSSLSGTYTPDGTSLYGSLFTSLTFKPGGKVEVTAMGRTQEASYEREGRKVKIVTQGSPATIFTIDEKGCLDGGELIGKFCKE